MAGVTFKKKNSEKFIVFVFDVIGILERHLSFIINKSIMCGQRDSSLLITLRSIWSYSNPPFSCQQTKLLFLLLFIPCVCVCVGFHFSFFIFIIISLTQLFYRLFIIRLTFMQLLISCSFQVFNLFLFWFYFIFLFSLIFCIEKKKMNQKFVR